MIAAIVGWLAKSMLMQSPIGRVLKAIPWQGYLAIALAVALVFAVRHHQHQIEQLRSTSWMAGYTKAVEDGKKSVVAIERKSDAVSTEIRSKTDEEIRRNARRADDLRVRGPGAAACRNPALPGGTGGYEPASGQSDAAGAGVPEPDRIAMPFSYIVDQAEVADANRAEVLAWREWHRRLTEEWAKAAANR